MVSTTLWIGSIPRNATEQDIHTLCEAYGVRDIKVKEEEMMRLSLFAVLIVVSSLIIFGSFGK